MVEKMLLIEKETLKTFLKHEFKANKYSLTQIIKKNMDFYMKMLKIHQR